MSQIIAISGSRTFPHLDFVKLILHMIKETKASVLVGFNPKTRRPEGVDCTVYDYATKIGIHVTTYPAVWVVNGRVNKGAGMIRNLQMIEAASHVMAFWDTRDPENSRGTAHAIVESHMRGKLFRLYPSEPKYNDDLETVLQMAYKVRHQKYVPLHTPSSGPLPQECP